MKADLHMHSTYSDGLFMPEELFRKAKENGVDVIAITDHDIVVGVEDNFKYSTEYGVQYIPGIELSTVEKGKPVHLLGYFTDDSYNEKELRNYFKEIKENRESRTRKFIENLKTHFDIDITYDEVFSYSRGTIARPHIAKAISNNYPQYDHDYIFDEFIGDNSVAYVPSCDLSVKDGIELLKRANCLVVLAHPVLLKPHIHDDVLVNDFDGIEAKYFRNKSGDEEKYTVFAKKSNMFITAGSDFHGIKNDTKHGNIGDIYLDGEDLDTFLNIFGK
jgi:predicted metal-dependent phosphoesterase TrpH